MMPKKVYSMALVIAGCVLWKTCFAAPVSSKELVSDSKAYDGKVVIFSGEVIGDIMRRKDFAWLNVNDGYHGIGIWAPEGLTKEISFTGSYKAKGDWIEIVGVFNRACPLHGGDLDIHAQSIRKVNSGQPVIERLNTGKRNYSLIFLGALCLILILRKLS